MEDLGIESVLIRLGEEGSLYCRDGGCEEVGGYGVKGVDRRGGGERFMGGVVRDVE